MPLNKIDYVNPLLTKVISQYVKYILNKDLEIILVEVFDDWNSDYFVQLIREDRYSNINGILFLCKPNSTGLARSRMIREFFKNSFQSRTCFRDDFISQTNELVFDSCSSTARSIDIVKSELKELKNLIGDSFYKIQDFFPFGGIHTTSFAHRTLRELYEMAPSADAKFTDIKSRIDEFEENYDLAAFVASNPKRCSRTSVLIIDDNPESVFSGKYAKEIFKYFPNETSLYITQINEWKKLCSDAYWVQMHNKTATLNVIEYREGEFKYLNDFKLYRDKSFFDVIVIDLLLEEKNRGNELIQRLTNFRKVYNNLIQNNEDKIVFDILVYSLSEEVVDISRSLKEGALNYINKKRSLQLPSSIANLYDTRLSIKKRTEITFTQKTGNFGKLYNLPEVFKRNLQNEAFLRLLDLEEENDAINKQLKRNALKWIQKIPKAELHRHMGGSIRANTAFYLSLNMLSVLQTDELDSILGVTLCVIEEIITNKGQQDCQIKNTFFKDTFPEYIFSRNEKAISFFEHSGKDKDKLESDYKNGRLNIQKLFFSFLSYVLGSDNIKIDIDQVKNAFNLCIGIIEGKERGSIISFWENQLSILNYDKEYTSRLSESFEQDYNEIVTRCLVAFDLLKQKIKPQSIVNTPLLSCFMSAEFGKTKSLGAYLGGNEFMGSNQLKLPENIFAAVFYIIEDCINDNIRYLEIRLSPDGYESDKLTTQKAINILLEGTDIITNYYYKAKGSFIRVNYIFTVKRHKDLEDAKKEVFSAVENRNRQNHHPQKTIDETSISSSNYNWKPASVVGLDLAGIEKGNPPSKFIKIFNPAFEKSSYITIHAGEEESVESIREAIYDLHANRIGHGLTLQEDLDLTELLKNLQICIELNPISNSLTNNQIEKKYPFFEYINKGINVSINTDNPAVSDCTLSKEYVKAAEFYRNHSDNSNNMYLSKWDTLRLVKNSFRSAFISREDKRELLRSVENEIYEILVKEISE